MFATLHGTRPLYLYFGGVVLLLFAAKYTLNFGTRHGRSLFIHTLARFFVSRSFCILFFCSLFPPFHHSIMFPSFLLTFLPSLLSFSFSFSFCFALLCFALLCYAIVASLCIIYIYNNIINKYLLFRLCVCVHTRAQGTRQSKAQKNGG